MVAVFLTERHSLPTLTHSRVSFLSGDYIYVAGSFQKCGATVPVKANGLVRWSIKDEQFETLPGLQLPTKAVVKALLVLGSTLYYGGNFAASEYTSRM
jgi:hypothetical protein